MKKFLTTVLIAFLLPLSAFASISSSPVNTATGSGANGASIFNITIPAPTNGNFLVLNFDYVNNNAIIASITQTGATWKQAFESHANRATSIWYAENVQSAGTTVTVTLSANATSNNVCAEVSEWSGVSATNSLDWRAVYGTKGSTALAATPVVTPAAGNNDLIIANARVGGNVSSGPTGSFTALTSCDNSIRAFNAYHVVASTSGSYQTTWTQTVANTWDSAIAVFSSTPIPPLTPHSSVKIFGKFILTFGKMIL